MTRLSFVAIALASTCLLKAAATGNRRVTANNKQSPPAETVMTLGGQTFTIEYNAPSARGRKVEGGLVPYGSIWRLGADAATTLTSTADLMIGTLRVPKGVHTLYILASEDGWKLVVNKQTGQWGLTYSEAQDLGRVDMKVSKLGAPVETLKINLNASGASNGTLEIEWGSTKASVPVKLP
jgi:hypothetical protein